MKDTSSRLPWFKFSPSDWATDPCLRMCGFAARGLWMEMLCIMHRADKTGYLMINGIAMTPRQLARIVGGDHAEVEELLQELRETGVFSEDEQGIFCRRMVRDAEKQDADRSNGCRGGNPKLKRGVGAGVNPPANPKTAGGLTGGVNRGVGKGDKADKEEEEDKEKEEEEGFFPEIPAGNEPAPDSAEPPPGDSKPPGGKRSAAKSAAAEAISGSTVPIPECLQSDGFPEAWTAFREHREGLFRTSKTLWSSKAAASLLTECAKHSPAAAAEAVWRSVRSGKWAGVFFDAPAGQGRPGQRQTPARKPVQTFQPAAGAAALENPFTESRRNRERLQRERDGDPPPGWNDGTHGEDAA